MTYGSRKPVVYGCRRLHSGYTSGTLSAWTKVIDGTPSPRTSQVTDFELNDKKRTLESATQHKTELLNKDELSDLSESDHTLQYDSRLIETPVKSPSKVTTDGITKGLLSLELNQEPVPSHSLDRLLSISLDPEDKNVPISFDEWSKRLVEHLDIEKIAEASYGEVYRLSLRENIQGLSKSDESVLKALALQPDSASPINAEDKSATLNQIVNSHSPELSDVSNVLCEVRLLQRLTEIPGFTNFRDVHIVKGPLSPEFLSAWHKYNDKNYASYDSSVSCIAPSHSSDQLWAIIEMQDAGTDLEHFQIPDVWALWDIFWSVVLALARAEQEAKFEHRDLHLGNICCMSKSRGIGGLADPIIHLDSSNRTLHFTDLQVTIIDYTLSRAELTDSVCQSEPEVLYFDLNADPAIFEGDASANYQYEIYRYMRSAMYFDNPLEKLTLRKKTRIGNKSGDTCDTLLPQKALKTGRTWRGFHPQTNLIWLHFVLYELLNQCPILPEHASSASRQNVLEVDPLIDHKEANSMGKKGCPEPQDKQADTCSSTSNIKGENPLISSKEILDVANLMKRIRGTQNPQKILNHGNSLLKILNHVNERLDPRSYKPIQSAHRPLRTSRRVVQNQQHIDSLKFPELFCTQDLVIWALQRGWLRDSDTD